MILLIDNYDSFTHNLAHLIGGLGRTVDVVRNDAITVEAAIAAAPEAIILSPGPRTPDDAGVCLELVRAAEASRTPLFGVCLGLQAIAQALGGSVAPASQLMHGKVSAVRHRGEAFFAALPSPFNATLANVIAEASV